SLVPEHQASTPPSIAEVICLQIACEEIGAKALNGAMVFLQQADQRKFRSRAATPVIQVSDARHLRADTANMPLDLCRRGIDDSVWTENFPVQEARVSSPSSTARSPAADLTRYAGSPERSSGMSRTISKMLLAALPLSTELGRRACRTR
ncbi:hypothetical protein, partial [Methylobacterium oxalidis]